MTSNALVKPLSLPELVERNAKQRVARRAENTRLAHAYDWGPFVEWCKARGCEPLPAPPQAIALYLTHLEALGRKLSSIERALSTISRKHSDAKAFPLPRQHDIVAETIEGLRRSLGRATLQKAPLLGEMLKTLATGLPDDLAGARDRALLTLGFAGAFRRSELVALDVADLTFGQEGLTVTLRRSKTDQEGTGRLVGVTYASVLGVCPVRSMRAWLDLIGATEGPVFCALDRRRYGARLTGHAVAEIVKKRARAAGLDPTRFSGHSLRAGFATSAAKAGKTERAIMAQTGHKSSAMLARYIREVGLFEDNASEGLL